MEVCLKVLEKLESTYKNNFKFMNLEHVTLKSDKIVKLNFSSNVGNQDFIIVKTTQNLSTRIIQRFDALNYMIFPVFFIDHNATTYAVFKGECIRKHQFQDHFDLDHIVLISTGFTKIHGYFLGKSSLTSNNDQFTKFLGYLEHYVQKIEVNLCDKKFNMNSKRLKTHFDKILAALQTTLEKTHWIPSVESFDINPTFIKYGPNGKPIDFKVLVLNSLKYVPPLYDILVFIFAHTTEESRKDNLHVILQHYQTQLAKELAYGIFNSEQFTFQISHFTPIIKLIRTIFDLDQCYNINNNLQELSEYLQCPRLLREECYEILANYLGHTKYLLQNFSLIPLQQRYGNLGDYFMLSAKINLEDGMEEVKVFLKFLPSNNESTNALSKNGPSMKEDFFYNFFIKEFGNCGLEKYLNFAPRCFMSKPNYVLVLEDLGLQGYRLYAEQNYFTYDMLKLTMKKLAQLHACSLVFEEKKSMELETDFRLDEFYGDYLKEVLFERKEENLLMTLVDVGHNTVTNFLIYLYPEVLRNLTMEEFHKRSKLTFERLYSKVLKSDTYRNTLCHGDTWDTNIMFKFDSNNSPVDCKLVDFQLTRYCPPIQDVMSHLYLTTNRDTRKKHLMQLLNEYYTELSRIIRSFGFNMETILSAKEFQNSCNYMKSQAVCQALLYAPINLSSIEERASIFSDSEKFENIMKIDRRPFIEEIIKRHPFYKERLGEYVQDLYDICENEQY